MMHMTKYMCNNCGTHKLWWVDRSFCYTNLCFKVNAISISCCTLHYVDMSSVILVFRMAINLIWFDLLWICTYDINLCILICATFLEHLKKYMHFRRTNLLTLRWMHETFTAQDDVIKWKHFPHYWPFVWGIHRSPVNSPHKGQWRGALMFSLICAWTISWGNNGDASDLRRHHAHYDVTVIEEGKQVHKIIHILNCCRFELICISIKGMFWFSFVSTLRWPV